MKIRSSFSWAVPHGARERSGDTCYRTTLTNPNHLSLVDFSRECDEYPPPLRLAMEKSGKETSPHDLSPSEAGFVVETCLKLWTNWRFSDPRRYKCHHRGLYGAVDEIYAC